MIVLEKEKPLLDFTNLLSKFQRPNGYTVELIENLPQGIRAELIDGHIYMMSAPSSTHQEIVLNISADTRDYIRRNKGKCKVYPAPFAVYLPPYTNNYLEPDISVICDPKKLNDKGCYGAPDWIIEVTSPSSKFYDETTKLNKYKKSGVREYWIVEPDEEKVIVYFFEKNFLSYYDFGDLIPVNIYNGDLVIDTGTILG